MNKAGVPLSYPIGIDSEDVFYKENGKTCKGRANSGVLSKAKRTEAIKAFCEEIKRYGYDSMIYGFKVFLDCQSFSSQGTVPIRDTPLMASFHVSWRHLGSGHVFSVCDTPFWR